ncbi:glycopeptide [Schizopora paradoxa]|uniref:Glycopeptide n=1 Tax=Schizopora paradoxa TaxID=27342 RepID=A0A0H2RYS2_9AGAM|nr:glycopeptide [Schizopora paradoxa]
MLSFTRIALAVAAAIAVVNAETHTVHFQNNCGFGTPTLVQNGNILSTGGDFTSNGPLISAIAYLQTGGCGLNGEGCTLIETTLVNPTSPGSGSSTDISLIPPHTFSVTSGFGYFDGCDGAGADCTSPSCSTAFMNPDQTNRQVACQSDNVNLAITFCD